MPFKKKKIKCKKASGQDIFAILLLLLVGSLLFLIASYTGTRLTEKIGTSKINQTAIVGGGSDYTIQIANKGINLLDIFFVILFFGLILGMIVTSMMTEVHPMFMVVYILLLIPAIVIAIPFSNAYQKVYNSPALNTTAAKFPMQYNIMSNLPTITAIIGIIGIIVLYSKVRNYGQGGGMI